MNIKEPLRITTVEHNEVPQISKLPKKDLDVFINEMEKIIKDYYSKQDENGLPNAN